MITGKRELAFSCDEIESDDFYMWKMQNCKKEGKKQSKRKVESLFFHVGRMKSNSSGLMMMKIQSFALC